MAFTRFVRHSRNVKIIDIASVPTRKLVAVRNDMLGPERRLLESLCGCAEVPSQIDEIPIRKTSH